ncbi:MAG: hypothetical protein NT157_00560, partial [Candidatus Micrarchaeota archaeon]|nr:hypothetical protein [Candidatus Micrarchaeota archaeon]
YLRADHGTDTVEYGDTGHFRDYFPGIGGLDNLYDSFYVPGNITRMRADIGLNTSYSTFFMVGNHTVFETNATGGRVILDDRNFSGPAGVNYPRWSNATVPIRIGSPNMSLSGTTLPIDAVLVTDVSGSMEWCLDQREVECTPCSTDGETCNSGEGWCGTQNQFWENGTDVFCGPKQISSCTLTEKRKIDSAMAAERTFADVVLTYPDNRVGIVEYSSLATVKNVSVDLRALNLTIYPNETLPGVMHDYEINHTVDTNGTGTIIHPFNATLFYMEAGAGNWGIVYQERFQGLNASQSVNRTVIFHYAAVNQTQFYYFVDRAGSVMSYPLISEVDETTEGNNVISNRYIYIIQNKPDLQFWYPNGLYSPRICLNDIRNIPPYNYPWSDSNYKGQIGSTYFFCLTWFDVINMGTTAIPAGTPINISIWRGAQMLNSTVRTRPDAFDPHPRRTNPGAGLTDGDFIEIGSLCFGIDTTGMNLPLGASPHYLLENITYVIDTPNVVDESNEQNNNVSKEIWQGGIDIWPAGEAPSWSRLRINASDELQVCTAGFYNFQFDLTLEVNHDWRCSPDGVWNVSIYKDYVNYSNPQSTLVWTNTTTFRDVSETTGWGIYYYWTPDVVENINVNNVWIDANTTFIAWVDHPPNGPTWNNTPQNFNGIIPEYNERNNNATARVVFTKPNLVITNWLGKPLPGCNGTTQNLEMQITVANLGGCPVTDWFSVGVYKEGDDTETGRIGNVNITPATDFPDDGRMDYLDAITVTVTVPNYLFNIDKAYWACVDDEPQYLHHGWSQICINGNSGRIVEQPPLGNEDNTRWTLEWLDPASGNELNTGGWVHVAFPNLQVNGTVWGTTDSGTVFSRTGLLVTQVSDALAGASYDTFYVCNPDVPRNLIINASVFNNVVSYHNNLTGGPFGDAHITGCPVNEPFEFRVFEGTQTTLGAQIFGTTINGMAGYGSQGFQIPWNGQTFTSPRWLHAVVDYTQTVEECNDYYRGVLCSNTEGIAPGQRNVRSILIEGVLPDIAVRNIAVSPSPTGPAEHVFNLTANVTSSYCGTINQFNVTIYLGACGTGEWLNSTRIGPLAPGQSVNVSLTFVRNLPVNAYTVSILVDSISEIAERNEANNCESAQLVVQSGAGTSGPRTISLSDLETAAVGASAGLRATMPAGQEPATGETTTAATFAGSRAIRLAAELPDIAVRELSVEPRIAACGALNVFRLRALVENMGDGSGEFDLVFRRDSLTGEEIGRARVGGLGKGQSAIAEARWLATIEGDVNVFALAEPKFADANIENDWASAVVFDPECSGDNTSIFLGGMVRNTSLTDDRDALDGFIDESETWFGTCICCGVIRAREMIGAQSPSDGSVLRAIVVMSDGLANVKCNATNGLNASEDAIQAACNAYSYENITVYTVGFGVDVDEPTLQAMADPTCGHGKYFRSVNTSDLEDIYRRIAEDLLNVTYHGQAVETSGPRNSTLESDSYIDIFYENSTVPQFGYGEVPITFETERFPVCKGSFEIPSWQKVFDIRATSYSSELWTDNVSIMRQPAGDWSPVYRLGRYGSDYKQLGDPFHIQFDPGMVSSGGTFGVSIGTGTAPDNSSSDCSYNNSVIYKALVPASVPFGDVLPFISGNSNVTVWYDIDGDGVPDGNITTGIGTGLDTYIDGNETDVSRLDNETNALHNAFVRLLDRLNFRHLNNPDFPNYPECDYITPSAEWGPRLNRSGTPCNPIDIEISPEIDVKVTSITEVPYMWGPIEVSVVAWVQKG